MLDDDLLGDPQNIEEIIENERDEVLYLEGGENEDNAAVEQNDDEGAAATSAIDAAGKPAETKKKKVQRPQARLNPERLKGPRGLVALEAVFKDMKFRGKGHEKQDLDHVMKRLELWAHRLFPKFQFDDSLEKIETLGHKRPVMTYVKRIRMGLVNEDEDALVLPEENDAENEPPLDDLLPIDEFDALISQQLSHIPTNSPVSAAPVPSEPSTTLSEQQRERMLRNRLLAEERRLARMKAQKEMQNADTLLESDTMFESQESSCPETTSQLGPDESNRSIHSITLSQPVFSVDSQLSSQPGTSSELDNFVISQKTSPQLGTFNESCKSAYPILSQPISSVDSQLSSQQGDSLQPGSSNESHRSTHSTLSQRVPSVDSQLSSHPVIPPQPSSSNESHKSTHLVQSSQPVSSFDSQLSQPGTLPQTCGSNEFHKSTHPVKSPHPVSSIESLRSFQNALLNDDSFIPSPVEEDSD